MNVSFPTTKDLRKSWWGRGGGGGGGGGAGVVLCSCSPRGGL